MGVRDSEQVDVAQEVWIVVHQKITSYEKRESALVWLATITRNVVKDWHRTRRRRPEFSNRTDDAAEPRDARTPETALSQERTQRMLYAFLAIAIQNEDRRDTFVLHKIFRMTVKEVAKATEVSFFTAQWRVQMANSEFAKAWQALTKEEREQFRAVVMMFPNPDAMIEAMRPKPSLDDVAHLWDRISKRIAEVDPGVGAHGGPAPALPPLPLPPSPGTVPGLTVTGSQVTAGLLATFLIGAGTGALVHALLSKDKAPAAEVVMMAEPSPPPIAIPGPLALLPPSAPTTSAGPTTSAASSARSFTDADSLFQRMRAALTESPALALALSEEHARLFPGQNAAKREDVAIRALIQLGRHAEAKERAVKLVNGAPSYRVRMEAILGPLP